MKLYELNVGDRFEFVGKHRSKIFEVESRNKYSISYREISTGYIRATNSRRKTFHSDVEIVTTEIVIKLTKEDHNLIVDLMHEGYKYSCENGLQETRGRQINKLFKKIR